MPLTCRDCSTPFPEDYSFDDHARMLPQAWLTWMEQVPYGQHKEIHLSFQGPRHMRPVPVVTVVLCPACSEGEDV